MIHSKSQAPERLTRIPLNHVPNEVLLTTVSKARNDKLPHYMSVAAGVAAPEASFGEANIDSVFLRFGARPTSVARAFLPQSVVSKACKAEMASLTGDPIGSTYEKDEDRAGFARTYRVSFETEINVHRVCEELSRSSAVECACPNHIRSALVSPSDEFYGFQWGLTAINCEPGWDIEKGHDGLIMAIVDSGIDLNHDDLSGKTVSGFDFVNVPRYLDWRYMSLGDYRQRDPYPNDEDGHGTHCAGIAAAASNNDRGVVGVCWGGGILPVRVMFRAYDWWKNEETSIGTDADIDAGIKFAIDAGAHVINLSLGGPSPSHERVLDYAHDRNVCVIAATGNDNSSAPSFPASNPNVLAVGAVDQGLSRAWFSNYGAAYNDFVMAPGVQIASTYKENAYVYLQGTSMATPFATGLAGLIVSRALRSGRQFSADDVYAIIRESASSLGSGKGDPFFGQGLINVEAALKLANERL